MNEFEKDLTAENTLPARAKCINRVPRKPCVSTEDFIRRPAFQVLRPHSNRILRQWQDGVSIRRIADSHKIPALAVEQLLREAIQQERRTA